MADEDVVIAKMDATANDVPEGFDVQVWVYASVEFVCFVIGFKPDFIKFDSICNCILDRSAKIGLYSELKPTKLDN